MSSDVTSAPAASPSPDGTAAMPLGRELIEMLAKGDGSSGSLKQLLSLAPLSDEQHTLVDLFLSLGEEERGSDATLETRTRPATASAFVAGDGGAPDGRRVRELVQEVADLREVNDTVAAALGACSACWGGDPNCPACAGHGRAGSAAPDPALFRELVVPAMRRVSILKREEGRAGFSRTGPDSLRQRRSFE